MKSRTMVIGAALALINVPVVVTAIEATTFFVSNRSNEALVSSGERRDYMLYVPKSYDRNTPTPLVISLHGAGLWGVAQEEISQWNRVADANGFIVVYPSGAGGHGPRVWRVDTGPGLMRDVKFISALIDTMKARYNIDTTRIYANGLSNGGGMSFVLSCTLSDRIAAVGMVGAAQTLPWSWCTDRRPVPMIDFHGTADPEVPYDGGSSWVAGGFPNVPGWAAKWARRNQCASNPTDSVVAPDITRRTYTTCADDATVVLYTIRGGGHTWPGGGPLPEWSLGRTSRSIDASSEMWAFFRAHPLTRDAQPGAPSKTQVLAAARDIMKAARYCTLVTIGPDGQPQARIVDPFQPDSELTIWIATNPATRKVQEIGRDPRITLLYFNAARSEYVTVIGTARLDASAAQKAKHWKPEWKALYKNENRGDDYVLVRVRPSRLEVSSVQRGLNNDPKTWRPVTIDLP